jgi:uridylate kinase
LNYFSSSILHLLILRSQASLISPFSGLILDEGSRSKKPYKWQRVLLKVSGEALAGDHTENIDPKVRMLLVAYLCV